MTELYIARNHITKLDQQPEFPRSDLTVDNADMLKQILQSSPGMLAQGEHLKHYQGYIHLIADYALKLSGVKTRYSEDELVSFSHGFASFETINFLVHPPRIYDARLATQKVQQLFLPPELDAFELEVAELLGAPDTYETQQAVFVPEIEIAERQHAWQEKLPNAFDVIVNLGENQQETMEQIHARTAGAHIAYQLATEDLDAA